MKCIISGLLVLVGAGILATSLAQCASQPRRGPLPFATKEQPFVNSLGMKFVPVPGTNILMCTTETTVAQYQAAGLRLRPVVEFAQGSSHPVIKVNWGDAQAWCTWLSRREGRKYRLPTSAEWSSAVGPTTYPWGNQWPPPANCGNYCGQEMRTTTEKERAVMYKGFELITGHNDGRSFTAPVGTYAANSLGLHDLGGNVWEWCQDRRPMRTESCLMRGGSWSTRFRHVAESSYRNDSEPSTYGIDMGFRCVIE